MKTMPGQIDIGWIIPLEGLEHGVVTSRDFAADQLTLRIFPDLLSAAQWTHDQSKAQYPNWHSQRCPTCKDFLGVVGVTTPLHGIEQVKRVEPNLKTALLAHLEALRAITLTGKISKPQITKVIADFIRIIEKLPSEPTNAARR